VAGDPLAPLLPWLGRRIEHCPCGRHHEVALRRVVGGAGALDGLADLVRALVPRGAPVLLLADPDTRDAAGCRARENLVRAGHPVEELLAGREPHCDDVTLEALAREIRTSPALLVAVGAGTINDLGKLLAARLGVPQVTVATAASMNGYASSIAAFTERGLKRTIPAPPPVALVLDADVLAAAPPRLRAAGFGDLLSKPVSSADWLLARALVDEPVCETALSLADAAAAGIRERAAAIGAGDPGAVLSLAVALVLSGISMAVAGASSPASGGEHLVSHYLDISAEARVRPPRLHGEQVAVGTLASLALYRRLREAAPPDPSAPPPPEEDDRALRRLHGHLPPRTLEVLLAEARAKRERRPDRGERRRRLARAWDATWRILDRQLAAGEGLAGDLRRAGAPTSFRDIDVEPERARHVVRAARHMRNRYTVLDLAADLGLLEEFAANLPAALLHGTRNP